MRITLENKRDAELGDRFDAIEEAVIAALYSTERTRSMTISLVTSP